MNLPILMYHKIQPPEAGNDLAVPVEAFQEQIHYLHSRGFQPLTLAGLARVLAQGKAVPKHSVILTFDDAYQSVFTAAWPVLAAAKFTATVFVVAQALDKHNFWDDHKGLSRDYCMTRAQLLELARSGWEIGSHGLTHANLTQCSEAELNAEIQGSRKKLEEDLGLTAEVFCYPFGAWDQRARAAIARAGYAAACAISPGTSSVTADLLALRRVYVKPADSLAAFKRKISPWYLRYRAWRKR